MNLPAICASAPRSYNGAMRQYVALIRRYKKAFDGGGTFGWDWPTFRINWPEGHDKARALVDYMNRAQQAANDYREIPVQVLS